jgi:peroxiredoxin
MDPHGLLADWLRTTFPGGPPSLVDRSLPPFLLPDADGWLVSSEDMRAQGPYVLSFFHGGWCGSCLRRLKIFEGVLDRIHKLGADLVACSPETLAFPRKLKAGNGLSFRILSDVDCALSIDLGLAFPVSEAVQRGLADANIDLRARHGDGKWMLPIPLTMVIDRRGVVAKTFAETEPRRNGDDIIEALAALAIHRE